MQRLKWEHDENSVGPDPPVSILVSQLSALTTSNEVALQFRTFGELAETKVQVDPSNGSSLGICQIVYRKNRANFHAAAEAAKNAVQKMNGVRLGGCVIKVELDDEGRLFEQRFKDIVDEREEARALAASAAKAQASRAKHEASTTSGNVPKGPKAMHRTSTTERSESRDRDTRDDREDRVVRERPEPKKYGKDSRSRDSSNMSSSASETNRRLGHCAYIFISGKVLPLHKVTAKELHLHFSGKKHKDIFTDNYGFYVVFDTDDLASHAHRTMDRSTFLGYRLFMELHKAKKSPAMLDEKPLGGAFKKTFQPVPAMVDPVMETTNRLIKELQDVFLRDIRSRVAGPALLEFLDPANFLHLNVDQKVLSPKPKNRIMPASQAIVSVDNVKNEKSSNEPKNKKLADVLMNMPRYKKEKAKVKDNGRMRLNHRMDHHAMLSDASDASEDDSRDRQSDRPSSVAPSLDFEEDGDTTPMRRIKSKVKARKIVQKRAIDSNLMSDDSSDREDSNNDRSRSNRDILVSGHNEDGNDEKLDVARTTAKRHEIDFTSSSEDDEPTSRKDKFDKGRESTIRKEPEETINGDKPHENGYDLDQTMSDAVEPDQSQNLDVKASKANGKKVKRRPVKIEKKGRKLVRQESPVAIQPDTAEDASSAEGASSEEEEGVDDTNAIVEDEDDVVLDIDGLQSIVKDLEDFDLLREVMQDTIPADVKDIGLWAWRQKEAKAAHADGTKGVTKQVKDSGYSRVNASGSARTEGYYAIPDIEKSYYLPNRNRAVVTEPGVGNSSSRMNRANNRRQAAGIEAQRQSLEAQTDLLRFNALKSRKKQLKFSRSAIHDWGLYALEHIERGDMVIEYVGEIIRQQVADHREKRYERQGIGSSYLFRIDEDTVIDATKCGNIARFINHSCDPSCTAKIITVYGQKKIVIYAQRDIGLGEEITYDYKFPLEDEKIPCLCGSVICRKYLN